MRVVLVLLLLARLGLAQEAVIPLRIHTDPAGANVSLVTNNNRTIPLGPSGETIFLNRAEYLPGGVSTFQVRLEKPGYKTRTETWPTQRLLNWKAGEAPIPFPAPGETVTLEATSWLTRYARLGWVAGGCAAVTGAALLLALHLRRKEKKARDRVTQLTSRIVPSNDVNVGATVGGYLLIKRLGRGGMATVYEALHTEGRFSETPLALKLLDRNMCEEEGFKQRFFEREVTLGGKLRHPNIVTIYEAGEVDGSLYLVMELVEGDTLRGDTTKPLPVATVLRMLEPVFGAVAYAHSQGVVHRDLKPENIMVTKDGKVKVMDFGLARSHQARTVTVTGSVIGTPPYMAPEQINEDGLNPATDQYALGVMVYELLAGMLPFDHPNPVQILLAHQTTPPPPLREKRPDLSPELERVVLKMLAKRPEERYGSVAEAFEALKSAR